jgi:hypothetical protein
MAMAPTVKTVSTLLDLYIVTRADIRTKVRTMPLGLGTILVAKAGQSTITGAVLVVLRHQAPISSTTETCKVCTRDRRRTSLMASNSIPTRSSCLGLTNLVEVT